MRRTPNFQTIRSEGGLLPPDLLRRVLDGSDMSWRMKFDGFIEKHFAALRQDDGNPVIGWTRLQVRHAEGLAASFFSGPRAHQSTDFLP